MAPQEGQDRTSRTQARRESTSGLAWAAVCKSMDGTSRCSSSAQLEQEMQAREPELADQDSTAFSSAPRRTGSTGQQGRSGHRGTRQHGSGPATRLVRATRSRAGIVPRAAPSAVRARAGPPAEKHSNQSIILLQPRLPGSPAAIRPSPSARPLDRGGPRAMAANLGPYSGPGG